MHKFIYIVLIIAFSQLLTAQPRCPYQPLKFVDVDFTWSHLQIDSSFVGYQDTFDALNIFELDGYTQMGRDAGSILTDTFLYSITDVKLSLRTGGYYIEKINIHTGDLLWQSTVNTQHGPYGYRVVKTKLIGDKLEIYGFRRKGGIVLQNGTYFHHTYETNTGKLLVERAADENDPRAVQLNTNRSSHYLFPNEHSVDYLKKEVWFENGVIIKRYQMDSMGYLIAPMDTVITSEYNYKWERDVSYAQVFSKSLERDVDSNFLFIDLYGPDQSLPEIAVEGKLKLLDQNYNTIRSKDLKDFPLQDWGSMDILHIDSSEILIGGCLNRNINIQCDHFVYRLDKDWNLIDYIDARIGRWLDPNVEIFMNTDTLMMIDPTFIFNDNSPVEFFKNKNGKLELVNTFIIEETNWVGFNDKSYILENGDLLMHFIHSCLVNDRDKGSWFAEWYRIPAHYFYFSDPVNNTEIPFNNEVNLYPNPVQDILHLDTESELDGHIIIYAINGSQVLTQAISASPSNQIDVSSLMPGLYTLSIINKDGVRPYKFIKL